ncbi:hypothetical protein [Caulobacter sp. BE254]|uniref:hypothetical protein n=1 Tax=Caulobacter sp. BE254 TaxID=2817720 RepID=UPI00285A7AED|nr:hypothetical protein [Caulobacter sp. BE254]MDR7118396.1 hypothetical protein [Caulobacter sp. BE254]
MSLVHATGSTQTPGYRPALRFAPMREAPTTGSPPADLFKLMESRSAALRELASFAALRENWDGNGAACPIHESLQSAASFLELLSKARDWQPSLHADGRAVLELDEPSAYVEIVFGPKRQISVYVQRIGEPGRARLAEFNGRALPYLISTI